MRDTMTLILSTIIVFWTTEFLKNIRDKLKARKKGKTNGIKKTKKYKAPKKTKYIRRR